MFTRLLNRIRVLLRFKRKIKDSWSVEQTKELASLHGLDVEQELIEILYKEIRQDLIDDYEGMCMSKILMSRDNPNGWKLEELLAKIRDELIEKNELLVNDGCDVSKVIQRNNHLIITNLEICIDAQEHTMSELDKLGEDQGATGTPRIGK